MTQEAGLERGKITLEGVLSGVDALKEKARSEGLSEPLIRASHLLETLAVPLIPNGDPLRAVAASEAVFLLFDAGDFPNALRLAEHYLANPELSGIHLGLRAVRDNIRLNFQDALAQGESSDPSQIF